MEWIREVVNELLQEDCDQDDHFRVQMNECFQEMQRIWSQQILLRVQMNECFQEILETVDRVEMSRYGRVIRRLNRLPHLTIQSDRNHHQPGKHSIKEPLQVRFRKRKQGFLGECPICLVQKPTIRTQCGHCFCRCIFKVCWKPGSACPYCRQEIRVLEVTDPDLYEILVLLRPVYKPCMIRIRQASSLII
jgi:hypothetical protein